MTNHLLAQMADQTGMKALHMYTAGDPVRNATFAFFADATTSSRISRPPPARRASIRPSPGTTAISRRRSGRPGSAWQNRPSVRNPIKRFGPRRRSPDHQCAHRSARLVPSGRSRDHRGPRSGCGSRRALANKATIESLGDYYKRINAPFETHCAPWTGRQHAGQADPILTNSAYTSLGADQCTDDGARRACRRMKTMLDGALNGQPVNMPQHG